MFQNRRRFLSASAAALSAPLFETAFAAPAASHDGLPAFPFGIQSYSLRHFGAEEAIQNARKLGLRNVEFYPGHLPADSSDEQLFEFQKLCRRNDVTMSAYGVVGFSADHAANERFFKLANKLGIRNLPADPDPESFESLDQLVADYGIRIAIHNHGPKHRYGAIKQIREAIEGHHPWIGVCVDTGHFIRSAEDPVEALRAFEGRVFGVHLKDFDAQRGDAKGTLLGKGQLDVLATLEAMAATHFPADGAFSIEYEENPESPLGDLEQCVATAREAALKVARG